MKKRFGELSVGADFEFAGKTLTKLDGYNAVTKVARGKQNFMFFKHNLVTVEDPELVQESPFTGSLGQTNFIDPIIKCIYNPDYDDQKFQDLVESISDIQPITAPTGQVFRLLETTYPATTVLRFNMVPITDRAYSLNMEADNQPAVSLIQMDKSDTNQWTVELPPTNVGGMVFRGLAVSQNDGYVSLSRYGEIIVQRMMSKENWVGGDTLTVVFNN